MGRRKQQEKELKRVVSSCQKLDSFILPWAKRLAEEGKIVSGCSPASSVAVAPSPTSPITRIVGVSDRGIKLLQVEAGSQWWQTGRASARWKIGSLRTRQTLVCAGIGKIAAQCELEDDVARKLRSLSASQKYALLDQHSWLPEGFIFPTIFTRGCNCSFRRVWVEEYCWLAYSTQADSAFRLIHVCALFNNSGVQRKLVTRPFMTWQKKFETCKEHQSLLYH